MTRTITDALPDLYQKALVTMRSRSPCPVETYILIRKTIPEVDLTGEGAEPVRRRFNAYYGVRRNASWRSIFYDRFENAKLSSLNSSDLFEQTLMLIHEATGRVEASFVSKLVATLRPETPIIDSVLRGWLSKYTDSPAFGGSVATAHAYYQWLSDVMRNIATSQQAQEWFELFDDAFPGNGHGETVSTTKKLDFLIWAGADR